MNTSLAVKPKLFYNAPDGAELIGVSLRHFRRIVEDKQIHPIQIGRRFFWKAQDIEQLQKQRRQKKSAAA